MTKKSKQVSLDTKMTAKTCTAPHRQKTTKRHKMTQELQNYHKEMLNYQKRDTKRDGI